MKDVKVIKCQSFGFIWANMTQDKKVKIVICLLKRYLFPFNRPSLVISNGGPAFSPKFLEFLDSFHVSHYLTSAHHPSSSGNAESGVKAMKLLFTKIGKITDNLVEESCFNTNNQSSPTGEGPPADR